MASPTLPTPRALITNLITTLSTFHQPSNTANTKPLHNAPQEVRSLLTTLHIIFPHYLLPALDLLDRQLVTKIIQRPAQDHQTIGENGMQDLKKKEKENSFYMVQSSQSTGRQRRPKSYVVRLHAWNCTCASFVFSAFPPGSSNESSSTSVDASEQDLDLFQSAFHGRSKSLGEDEENREADLKWEFGGTSFNGQDRTSVPACKHLLAAVLVDRWDALRGMVTERWVGREEMAGLGAGF